MESEFEVENETYYCKCEHRHEGGGDGSCGGDGYDAWVLVAASGVTSRT